MKREVEIVPYKKELAPYFRQLNEEWLKKYFYIEPKDVEVLGNPEQYILQKGGQIFFAKVGDAIVGTFALIKEEDGICELGKMAVSEQYQGKSIGNRLLQHCVEQAQRLGAAKVILYSNTILAPAIHLYQKYGFKEVPLESSDYKLLK